jgi:enterochelin esterase-like enzyme
MTMADPLDSLAGSARARWATLIAVAWGVVACTVEGAPGVGVGGTAGAAGSTAGMAGAGGSGSSAAGSAGTAQGGSTAGVTSGGAGGSTSGSAGAAGSSGSGGAEPQVSSEGDGDIVVGPTYMKDPNLTDLGNPKGKRFTFSMSSENSIFKGTDATLTKPANKQVWSRAITVYVPALYEDGDEAPILVIQEGQIDNVSRALDNLTISEDAAKKLPPFVAIAVANGSDRDGADGQGSERGLEYDTLSDRYSKFINMEVLPAVLANADVTAAYPNLKFTSDPEGRGTMGCSSGGAAALSMGWFATDSFHRIITYSGTFVDQQNHSQPEAELYPFGAWEYHSTMKLIENTPKKPLRIFLHASENDNGANSPEDDHHNWVMANERTAAALKTMGYHYRFVFSKATGHCDGKVFDLTLADTLSWVWRGYVAK